MKIRCLCPIRAIIFAVIGILVPAHCLAGHEQYKVIRVVDGDTNIINYHGKKERVRLLRVDTPESIHPDKKQNIPMGKTASNFNKKRLNGKNVDLEFEGEKRDKYDRLLAYVFVNDQNFCLELVKQGVSPNYPPYCLFGLFNGNAISPLPEQGLFLRNQMGMKGTR